MTKKPRDIDNRALYGNFADSVVAKTEGYNDRISAQRKREERDAKKRGKQSWEDRRQARAIDTIDAMGKRRQLDARQVLAAATYRESYGVVLSQMKGTLDPDSVGGGSAGNTPSEALLIATERVNQAAKILGQQQGAIVSLIVIEGHSIGECAVRFCGKHGGDRRDRADREYIGRVLSDGLTALADKWHPLGQQRGIRTMRPDHAKPVDMGEAHKRDLTRSHVVHASSYKVIHSGVDKRRG